MTQQDGVRLQKFLAHAGVCSRRAAEGLIADGKISVNGVVVTEPGSRVDPDSDRVAVDGKPVGLEERSVYVLLNKPLGVISSCSHGNAKVVTDLVDVPERIYPVGRLDIDSSGLLLLTNDGRIHHQLSHPSFDHEKEYRVRVKESIPTGSLKEMEEGIRLKEGETRPCRIKREGDDAFTIILQEGKNRQIRRMVQAVGHEVVALKRVRMASIRLGNVRPGAWRYLTANEVATLLRQTGLDGIKGRRKT